MDRAKSRQPANMNC